MHELLVVAGPQIVLQVPVLSLGGYVCWRRRTTMMTSCRLRLFFCVSVLFFYSIAGLLGALVWHIVMTVQAANGCKASTLFAGMEAALQRQSFQPAKKKVCS